MAKRTIKKRDGSGLTLEQAFTEFIQEKEALNLSEATIRNYVQSYNMFVMFNGRTTEKIPSSKSLPALWRKIQRRI